MRPDTYALVLLLGLPLLLIFPRGFILPFSAFHGDGQDGLTQTAFRFVFIPPTDDDLSDRSVMMSLHPSEFDAPLLLQSQNLPV